MSDCRLTVDKKSRCQEKGLCKLKNTMVVQPFPRLFISGPLSFSTGRGTMESAFALFKSATPFVSWASLWLHNFTLLWLAQSCSAQASPTYLLNVTISPFCLFYLLSPFWSSQSFYLVTTYLISESRISITVIYRDIFFIATPCQWNTL